MAQLPPTMDVKIKTEVVGANPIVSLFRSRKFLLALFGVVQVLILHYLDVPRDVWISIEALVAVLIGAIAYEDGMEKSAPATINAGSVESMTTNTTEVAKDR